MVWLDRRGLHAYLAGAGRLAGQKKEAAEEMDPAADDRPAYLLMRKHCSSWMSCSGSSCRRPGNSKMHYSRLGEILREYLLRRLGISSYAETSEELIGEIRRRQLVPPVIYDSLAEALRMSDFVKFAKYQPGVTDSHQHYRDVTCGYRVDGTPGEGGRGQTQSGRPGETGK